MYKGLGWFIADCLTKTKSIFYSKVWALARASFVCDTVFVYIRLLVETQFPYSRASSWRSPVLALYRTSCAFIAHRLDTKQSPSSVARPGHWPVLALSRTPCLFIADCLSKNGVNLLQKGYGIEQCSSFINGCVGSSQIVCHQQRLSSIARFEHWPVLAFYRTPWLFISGCMQKHSFHILWQGFGVDRC